MTWEEWKADWTTGWNYLWNEAQATYQSAIETNPADYVEGVERFLAELTGARRDLDTLHAGLPAQPGTEEEKAMALKVAALEQRYHEVAAGFYAEATEAESQEVGIVPLLVVGGLALSAAAVAWAIPGYEYAANLREQTSLAVKELEARIAASEQGRTLQASTLPPPAPELSAGLAQGAGKMLMGGLALAAGGLLVRELVVRGRKAN